MDAEFEWDERKASENVAKHGVSFETARLVFKDIFATERADERFDYGEQRINILGMVRERLLSVIYSVRGQRIRIISAREAVPQERRRYHEANAEFY